MGTRLLNKRGPPTDGGAGGYPVARRRATVFAGGYPKVAGPTGQGVPTTSYSSAEAAGEVVLNRATDTGEYMYILVTAILAILITGIGGTLAYFCRLPELDETPNDPN